MFQLTTVIVLVHHGEAASPAVDSQRPLTEAGRAGVERVVAAAAARGAKPAEIWHSGKLRARQTGEALWRACNPLAVFTMVRGLQPGDPPEVIGNQLAGDTRELMLVGHMPHLAWLLALLVGGDATGANDFPLHGVVALEPAGTAGRWREVWRVDTRDTRA